MDLQQPPPEVQVFSVQFSEELVSIAYAETREANEFAGVQKTIHIDPDYVEDELAVLLQQLRDMIDSGLLLIRRPPEKLNRRRAALEHLDEVAAP